MTAINRQKTGVPRNPLSLMKRVYKYVLPEVRSCLKDWRTEAERIPDAELRKQAIDSMTSKQFHCEGGAIYAAADLQYKHVLVPLIVALQTISDYLDNLCDRSTSMDARDFRLLHQAMLDAVNPSAVQVDYYALRSEKEDGGYLGKLVATCQSCISQLPAYPLVQDKVAELVSYYSDLQVYKHIRHDLREGELQQWWETHRNKYPDLLWNEFAAATGSTLGMFMLFLAAADRDLDRKTVERIRGSYFPYICGLHILLDYLIDREEDLLGGDLNFCEYYGSDGHTAERIQYMARHAREAAMQLQDSSFHRMIIEGLLALYLSDPKVLKQRGVRQISRSLMRGSPMTRLFFLLNSKWIRKMM